MTIQHNCCARSFGKALDVSNCREKTRRVRRKYYYLQGRCCSQSPVLPKRLIASAMALRQPRHDHSLSSSEGEESSSRTRRPFPREARTWDTRSSPPVRDDSVALRWEDRVRALFDSRGSGDASGPHLRAHSSSPVLQFSERDWASPSSLSELSSWLRRPS